MHAASAAAGRSILIIVGLIIVGLIIVDLILVR